MLRLILSALLLVVNSYSFAEPQLWMKQENPDELGTFTSVLSSDCSITREELKQTVEGEFLRARIKPISSTSLHLTVELVCINVKSGSGSPLGTAMSYRVDFGTMIDGSFVNYDSGSYGNLMVAGKNGKQYQLDSVRNAVSEALTDYLKANYE